MKILAIIAGIFAISMLVWFIWAFIVSVRQDEKSDEDGYFTSADN